GRDVDDAHLVREATVFGTLAEELVDGGEEGGERLPGAGGRRDERVLPVADRGPAFGLRLGRRAKAARPPAAEHGMEICGKQGPILTRPGVLRSPAGARAVIIWRPCRDTPPSYGVSPRP